MYKWTGNHTYWVLKKITEACNPKQSSKFVRGYGVLHSMLRNLMSLFIKIISLYNPINIFATPTSLPQYFCHSHITSEPKWKHFPRYWPFEWGIHWSPVNSPHKGQWCGALMFSLIFPWINSRINKREAGDLRCHRAHYDITVMESHLLNLSHRSL